MKFPTRVPHPLGPTNEGSSCYDRALSSRVVGKRICGQGELAESPHQGGGFPNKPMFLCLSTGIIWVFP